MEGGWDSVVVSRLKLNRRSLRSVYLVLEEREREREREWRERKNGEREKMERKKK